MNFHGSSEEGVRNGLWNQEGFSQGGNIWAGLEQVKKKKRKVAQEKGPKTIEVKRIALIHPSDSCNNVKVFQKMSKSHQGTQPVDLSLNDEGSSSYVEISQVRGVERGGL